MAIDSSRCDVDMVRRQRAILMSSSDNDAVYYLAIALREVPCLALAEPLAERLERFQDPGWVREALITALGITLAIHNQYTPNASDILRRELRLGATSDVRSAAALALGWIGDTAAVDLLLQTLEAGEEGMTIACITALGDIGDAKAVEPLAARLQSSQAFVPQVAAHALGKIGTPARIAILALRQLATTGNPMERRAALEAIAAIDK